MENTRGFWKAYADENWAKAQGTSAQTGNKFGSEELFYVRVDEIRRNLYLDSGATVLDLGGGVGWVAYCLSPFVNKWVLVEFSHESVERAKKILENFPGVEIVEKDMVDYEIDCQPSRVLAAGSMLHLGEMEVAEGVIKKVYDALPPGGIALFTQLAKLEYREMLLQEDFTLNKIVWFEPGKLVSTCNKMGFRAIDAFEMDNRNYKERWMFNIRLIK